MNHTQPIPSIVPIESWRGSLRPNATTLRAAAQAPRSRRLIVAGPVTLALTAGVAGWVAHRHHARVEPVPTVVSGRAGLRKTSAGNPPSAEL